MVDLIRRDSGWITVENSGRLRSMRSLNLNGSLDLNAIQVLRESVAEVVERLRVLRPE